MKKVVYEVESLRYGPQNGYHYGIGEMYQREYDNYDDAKADYDECIRMTQDDTYEYDFLWGNYPYNDIILYKDDEELESFSYKIPVNRYDAYRETPWLFDDDDEWS